MPSDLIVLTASNGENRKLAERFVQAAAAQNASAELIDLTQLDLPLFTPRVQACLLYTSPSPRDRQKSRMPSSA